MSVTPTGFLSRPLAMMRDMIAASAAFQSWTASADATEAATYVHLLAAPANAERPFALVDFGDFVRERDAVQNGIRFRQRIGGSNLVVWFQDDVAPQAVEPDATMEFCNQVGAVWADLELAAGKRNPETLNISQFELVAAPARVEEQDRQSVGDYFECAISPSFSGQNV